ncbi:MBOAT family O-acyltransferase [Achromobacter deleyi]|uniref:MBOAT family O-acyltransferase n=1 Tax=Achromobacter deleyi TaxID=1353891 RepID=UPI001492A833|nr:MBOAT family protein [Achromobacter deleyi]QVQ28232.1 MBOAT family protein [Achromobacter deleyi]UIP18427.1 MBOAT family protein [Achromobacter deleyi]
MLFNSLPFMLMFLPLSLGGYYLLGAIRPMAAAAWLCIASLVFYGWWDPHFVVLLLASITFNYVVSLGILATESRPRAQLWILAGGIVANLSLLFYYKYLVALLGFLGDYGLVSHSVSDMILPLGISFFTFTQLGFLLDCRAGVVRERGFVSYVLFVTFFPHLIAGPILHHKEMMPQFANRENYRFKAENLSIGVTLFVIGLAKKVLLADSIAPWAEAGFNQPGDQQFLGAWGTALAYALQLYFDFSGYSDMAIGLAKMFGISFPLNFNSPFKATGIIEFWQRFHMTLTRYLTAYLYNPVALAVTRARARKGLPVGRKATKTVRGFSGMILFPTVFTMGLAGVWHGAGLQFLIFGLLHGFYLTINHAWRQFGPARGETSGFLVRAGFVLLTFLCVVVALLFFRAHSTSDAFSLIAGMIGLHGLESLQPVLFPIQALLGGSDAWTSSEVIRLMIERWSQGLLIAALLAIVWCAPNSNQMMSVYAPSLEGVDDVAPRWLRWRPTLSWALITAMVLFYAMLHLHKTARFLYFQF